MALWRPLPGVVRSRRALMVSLVQLSCRRYQLRGVLRALPLRVARRRSGSQMVVGVRGGVLRVRGGRAWWVAGVLRVPVDVWVAVGGHGWAGRCRVALWVRGGHWGAVAACGGGALRWCPLAFWGALVVSWRPAGGDGGGGVFGARSGLVDFWVMQGMVMDEMLHVFPGGGVAELFPVCQQQVFAVYHLGRCSADCF